MTLEAPAPNATHSPHESSAASEPPAPDDLRPLPLQGAPQARPNGWAIRLPVRAEHVDVEKQLVVYEQVTVRRYGVDDTEHIEATLRREELHIAADHQ